MYPLPFPGAACPRGPGGDWGSLGDTQDEPRSGAANASQPSHEPPALGGPQSMLALLYLRLAGHEGSHMYWPRLGPSIFLIPRKTWTDDVTMSISKMTRGPGGGLEGIHSCLKSLS